MLPMTWPIGRLGSRFGLLFEPSRRCVMHSALGRFFDQPLDLAVGVVEPDGTERAFPFTAEGGEDFYAIEQNERINSITWRGYCPDSGLRFEMNIHSPFYPQNEKLCTMPVFYLELRILRQARIRMRKYEEHPEKVKLFIRLKRPDTEISASDSHIDLQYDVPVQPYHDPATGAEPGGSSLDPRAPIAHVVERIHSLNDDAVAVSDERGTGLQLDMPVTAEGSGTKWRFVWAAHTSDQILNVDGREARPRYLQHWPDLDTVIFHALEHRDDYLALSRRFEKLLEQAPLTRARWHLLVMAFQSWLTNTWWCDLDDGEEFFSVWEGSFMYHNTLDVGYNMCVLYLTIWPRLMKLSMKQWAARPIEHNESGGLILPHDAGVGLYVREQSYDHLMPVEENTNFLIMVQAYAHWTGDTEPLTEHAEVCAKLAAYLLWCDRDGNGFPDEGTANTLDDGAPAVQLSKCQTYLAIKRAAALEAAADILNRVDDEAHAELAERCRTAAASAVRNIEAEAWLDDHYAVCIDRFNTFGFDGQSSSAHMGETILLDQLEGWDDYSIYTSNGLLLPMLTAQPLVFDRDRLRLDLLNAHRETLRPYGCAHTSGDTSNVWISQNLWRDHIARYLHADIYDNSARYWDLLVWSNSGGQSLGFSDSHVSNELVFNPRGVTSFAYFLTGPRLVIDRLDDEYFAVDPERRRPDRWPLLPLADWAAGKIPICVTHEDGRVTIEGEIEPVKIIDRTADEDPDTIG